ncbi:MAG TPA: hypothetical protein EYO23_04895 [Alphaproteobacteria bacterium]|nr:hypothetical protein [Alphaproteobacteria bacterium]
MADLPFGESTGKSAEELNNSAPLDVHRWSEYGEVNDFVNQIYEQHFSDSWTDLEKKHLKVVLLDLYVIWTVDPDRCIAIHLNNNRYRAKSRYNSLHISRKTIDVATKLHEVGLIHSKRGFYDRAGYSKTCRIWPTQELVEHFTKARFSVFDISSHAERESLILHDEQKKDVQYEDTSETRRMRKVLSDYNELLSRTHIDCAHLDHPYVVRADGKRTYIDQQHKFIYRVFNNSSWEEGGRFYGGWWELVSEHRRGIRINGERTIELDYRGLHVVFLYALKNINYYHELSSSDPYEVHIPETNDPKFARELAKRMMLSLVNATDERKVFKAVQQKTNQLGDCPSHMTLTFKLLRKILAQLRLKHPQIEEYFLSGAGTEMQFLDSQMTELIVKHFTAKGIPVLTVHDSYVIQERYRDELMDQMDIAWQEVTHLESEDFQIVHGGYVAPDHLVDHDAVYEKPVTDTAIKQIGYVDELEGEDWEEHLRIESLKESEYVSQRYSDNLELFREWVERKTS